MALCIILPAQIQASQDAMVSVEQAAVRERPSTDSKIIESKPTGEKIRVSSFSKDGWYKIKSNIGQYGWIWQNDITLLNMSSDVKAANLEMTDKEHDRRELLHERWLFLRLGGSALSLIDQVGDTSGHLHLAAGGYGEVAVRITEGMRGAVRLMAFGDLMSVTSMGSTNFDVFPGGVFAMLGAETEFSTSTTHDLAMSLYAGPSLANSVSVTRSDGKPPANFAVTGTAWAFLANFTYRYIYTNLIRFVGDVGFMYVYTPRLPIPNFGVPHVSEYGPSLSLGVEFAF